MHWFSHILTAACLLQVQEMAAYLHIKPHEGQYIRQVAEMALCAPLPPGWKQVQEQSATGLQMMFK